MSLHPQPFILPVPDDTARVARAAFRRGNPCLLLRDRLCQVSCHQVLLGCCLSVGSVRPLPRWPAP